MGSGSKVWYTGRLPICNILKEAYQKSSFTLDELADLLNVDRWRLSGWFLNRLPSPEVCLDLAALLDVDIIAEILSRTTAPYFRVYFQDFLDDIWCSDLPKQGRNVIGRWKDFAHGSRIPNYQEMRWIYNYVGDREGFKEMVDAWFACYYCELIKFAKAQRENADTDSSSDITEKDTDEILEEPSVKLEVPMDGTKEHPMTFYIHLDRVKAFVLEHGWSYIPDDLELYTSMVAAYAYQFFYGDSCDVLPRHLPTLSSEGGSYYYASDDPTVGCCQIKSMKDFDFGGYLRARGVIPVITFDKEQDTMFRNLQ